MISLRSAVTVELVIAAPPNGDFPGSAAYGPAPTIRAASSAATLLTAAITRCRQVFSGIIGQTAFMMGRLSEATTDLAASEYV